METGRWINQILAIEASYKYLRFYNEKVFSLIFEFSRIIELLFGWKPREEEKKKRGKIQKEKKALKNEYGIERMWAWVKEKLDLSLKSHVLESLWVGKYF